MKAKYPIVTVCGSTKFKKEYEDAILKLSLQGKIVLSVICFSHADGICLTEEEKELADALHKEKIRISDEIYVVNPGNYIGSSTKSEIDLATELGIPVTYAY